MSLGAWFWLASHYPLLEAPKPVGAVNRHDRTNRKLSESDVLEIKRLRAEGVILKDIAKQFGVSIPAIHHIVKGRKR